MNFELITEFSEKMTVNELWRAGYHKWALWKLCPFSLHNPRYILGEFQWPVGCLKRLKLM
jgi:hypothetical protein